MKSPAGQWIDPADAFHGADIERILRAQIAGMGLFDLAAGLTVPGLLLKGCDLAICQHHACLGHMDFQDFQTLFEVGQVVPESDGAHAGWGYEDTPFAQLV